MDPIKSTEAACLYLKYLYRIFNDWNLVMAAYNVGPGAVKNAIQRSGGETNFWKLYDYLPEAAQNYVPAFIAATYIMQNAEDHKIMVTSPLVTYFHTDTVHVTKPISFTVISDEIGIPVDLIRFLNPIFRRGLVPKYDNHLAIRIPESKIEEFIQKEAVMYEKTKDKADYHDVTANAGNNKNKIMVIHSVLAGDYLHKIAVKYNCTVDDIMVWNTGLSGDLAIGQPINIWVDKMTYQRMQQFPDSVTN
jgi:membrane-bound lytic murein transglycosylase D